MPEVLGSIVRPSAGADLKTLSKRFRVHIALIVAMVMLAAQFGAQAHAYSHLHPGGASTQQLDLHDSKLCFECLAFAPLLTGAGAPSQPYVVAPQGVTAAPDATVASLISRPPTLAFRSRAPPSTH